MQGNRQPPSRRRAAVSACQESPFRTFLTALAAEHFAQSKMLYPGGLEKSRLPGRRFIQLENSRFPLPVAEKGNPLFRSSMQCGKESNSIRISCPRSETCNGLFLLVRDDSSMSMPYFHLPGSMSICKFVLLEKNKFQKSGNVGEAIDSLRKRTLYR